MGGLSVTDGIREIDCARWKYRYGHDTHIIFPANLSY